MLVALRTTKRGDAKEETNIRSAYTNLENWIK